MSSTREGAELLSQYGWESRWNTRAEKWPLVEDRSLLLADSMEDLRPGPNFGGVKMELGSPISNLDYIAEEHLQSGKFVYKPSQILSSGCDEDSDSESGIVISHIGRKGHLSNSPEQFRRVGREKSQTFPFVNQRDSRTLSHFPIRSQTMRVISGKHKTQSVENIIASRDLHKISNSNRSQSMHIVMSKSDSLKAVISDSKSATDHVSIVTKPVDLKDSNENDLVRAVCKSVDSERMSEKVHVNTSEVTGVSKPPSDKTDTGSIVVGDIGSIHLDEGSSIKISVTDTDKEKQDFSSTVKVENYDVSNRDIADQSEGVLISKSNGDGTHPVGSSSASEDVHSKLKAEDGDNKTLESDISRDTRLKRSVVMKDERSSSSESSRTTKSRTDSFNTDSVTSGVGSYDSGHHGGVSEFPSLSPIPSTNSLDHVEVQMRRKDNMEATEYYHPSTILRRQSNLSRVPSIRRQSNTGTGILPASKYFDFSENAIMYTTARDAIGYATLRSLMKTRTISSDVESDYGLNNLYETGSMSSRRPSIDSTDGAVHRPQRLVKSHLLPYNVIV